MAVIDLKAYDCLCELCLFTINGQPAIYEDFVKKYDHDKENAEDYCCGDMRCDPVPVNKEVLKKYNITEQEYDEIVSAISEALHFGDCCWCD